MPVGAMLCDCMYVNDTRDMYKTGVSGVTVTGCVLSPGVSDNMELLCVKSVQACEHTDDT
jgi:hypothetical protein